MQSLRPGWQRQGQERAAPYALLLIVLALVMWPAWAMTDRLVVGGDAVAVHYPYFVLWRDLLAAGEWPFWNPYSFTGLPAFATLQAGYGYPPHWLLTPLPPIMAMNWLVGLHVLLAGLGAAWCAGRLGATPAGQVLAGLAYALGSALTARMWAGHVSFVETNAWLPLATGFAIEIGRRHGVARLALTVAMMALAGQPEIVIFSFWWLPLWALGAATRAEGGRPLRSLVRTGLGIGLGLGLAAFQLLPAAQMLAISNRQAGMGWDFLTGASLPPWHLLGLFGPLVFGDPRGQPGAEYWPGPGYEWHERLLFVGVVPLLAAGFAGGRWRWVCWGGALMAVALAFGRYVPWYAWAQWLPGYSTLRIPSKHLTLAALALALAAGIGLPRLRGRGVALGALALAAGLALAGATMEHWQPGALGPPGCEDRLAASAGHGAVGQAALRGLVPGIVALVAVAGLALVRRTRWRHGLLVALAATELLFVLLPFRTGSFDPWQIVARAGLPSGYSRVAVLDGDAIAANFGPVLGVQQPGGYVSLFSGNYMLLLTGTVNPGVVLSAPRDAVPVLHLLGYEAVLDWQASTLMVFDPPPPRAWVARCVRSGGAREARAPSFPRQSCITRASAPEQPSDEPPLAAEILGEGPGRLSVRAPGPGWLVLAQPWYPGWRAAAGSAPLMVEAVDGALVGVELPEGEHTVQITYQPGGLGLGLAISAATALVLAYSWWQEWRSPAARRRPP